MSAEWQRLYRDAFQELDAEKVSVICERARRSINDRLIELATQNKAIGKERGELLESLRNLLIQEYQRRAPN